MLIAQPLLLARFRLASLPSADRTSSSPPKLAQRETLTAIRANAHWKLPTEFLVVERTEAEWVELRAALANERIAARNEEAPNEQRQALLGTARANPAVAAAKTALDANLATVKQSWNTVTGD